MSASPAIIDTATLVIWFEFVIECVLNRVICGRTAVCVFTKTPDRLSLDTM
jgi:hypothetical protein